MTRHSKNNTASSVFTYAERGMLKYGTQKKRIGRDSMRDYDACFLCLHTVRDPLCCPQGHLACKECFYESILAQKRDIARNLKLAEEQQKAEQLEQADKGAQAQQALVKEFEDAQMSINRPTRGSNNEESPFNRDETSEKKVFRMTAEGIAARQELERQRAIEQIDKIEKNKAKLPSFWVPHLTPEVKANGVDTSKTQPTCTGSSPHHPIGIKKLIPVKFTYLSDKQEKDHGNDTVTTAEERRQSAVCPSCSKSLTNSMKLILSKQCGHVLCSHCIEKFVKPSKQCFVCEKKCKDMITLKSEGTGFAAGGGQVQVTKYETAFIG